MKLYFRFLGTFKVRPVKQIPDGSVLIRSVLFTDGTCSRVFEDQDGNRYIQSEEYQESLFWKVIERTGQAFVPDSPALTFINKLFIFYLLTIQSD